MTVVSASAGMVESEKAHARLRQVSLAVEESWLYWQHARPDVAANSRVEQAFAERWFGSKRMSRVRVLLYTFAERFDAYPPALEVLHLWCPTDLDTRRAICHWHTQLSDPFYRRFTGDFLPSRWSRREPTVDSDAIVRWVEGEVGERWSPATTLRYAQGLLAAATEAGLCREGAGKRALMAPRVPDDALTYLLYLLRAIDRRGGMLDSPYLTSVSLGGVLLEQQLRRLSALSYRRHGELHDFGWRFDDLRAWARASFDLTSATTEGRGR